MQLKVIRHVLEEDSVDVAARPRFRIVLVDVATQGARLTVVLGDRAPAARTMFPLDSVHEVTVFNNLPILVRKVVDDDLASRYRVIFIDRATGGAKVTIALGRRTAVECQTDYRPGTLRDAASLDTVSDA